MANIVFKKETSGNVRVYGGGNNKRFSPSRDFGQSKDGTKIQLYDSNGGVVFECLYSDVRGYIPEGSTAITAAPALIENFLSVLSGSFFFELSAGQLPASIVRTGEVTVNIATSANNLAIPNIERVSIIRLNASVPLVITGFVAPNPVLQQEFLILNIGAQVQLTRESLLSTAGNRFAGVNATETIVATNGSRRMIYDTSINRFKILQ